MNKTFSFKVSLRIKGQLIQWSTIKYEESFPSLIYQFEKSNLMQTCIRMRKCLEEISLQMLLDIISL